MHQSQNRRFREQCRARHCKTARWQLRKYKRYHREFFPDFLDQDGWKNTGYARNLAAFDRTAC
jgi:hypothetical protein